VQGWIIDHIRGHRLHIELGDLTFLFIVLRFLSLQRFRFLTIPAELLDLKFQKSKQTTNKFTSVIFVQLYVVSISFTSTRLILQSEKIFLIEAVFGDPYRKYASPNFYEVPVFISS
jgi:hypothetical protein